jgi:uncharacterized phage protein gp47/JayE
MSAGVVGNFVAGVQLRFETVPVGIEGAAVVDAPGFAGGADIETDDAVIARYLSIIQEPPHGGNRNDYLQWALEVPGVTRAWAAQEMGIGTVTVRVMLDQVRAAFGGFPQPADLAAVATYLDALRPVTVADLFVVAPIAQPMNLTIADLAGDTPEIRTAIRAEIQGMLRQRAGPGAMVYASWVIEAVSIIFGRMLALMTAVRVRVVRP